MFELGAAMDRIEKGIDTAISKVPGRQDFVEVFFPGSSRPADVLRVYLFVVTVSLYIQQGYSSTCFACAFPQIALVTACVYTYTGFSYFDNLRWPSGEYPTAEEIKGYLALAGVYVVTALWRKGIFHYFLIEAMILFSVFLYLSRPEKERRNASSQNTGKPQTTAPVAEPKPETASRSVSNANLQEEPQETSTRQEPPILTNQTDDVKLPRMINFRIYELDEAPRDVSVPYQKPVHGAQSAKYRTYQEERLKDQNEKITPDSDNAEMFRKYIASLRAELSADRTKAKNFQKALQDQQQSLKENLTAQIADNKSLRSQIKDNENRSDTLSHSNDNLIRKLTALKNELNTKTQTIRQFQFHAKAMTVNRNLVEEKLRSYAGKYEDLTTKFNDTEEALKLSDAKLEWIVPKYEALAKEVFRKHEAIGVLEGKIHALEEKEEKNTSVNESEGEEEQGAGSDDDASSCGWSCSSDTNSTVIGEEEQNDKDDEDYDFITAESDIEHIENVEDASGLCE